MNDSVVNTGLRNLMADVTNDGIFRIGGDSCAHGAIVRTANDSASLDERYAAAIVALHARDTKLALTTDTRAMRDVRRDVAVMAQILEVDFRITGLKNAMSEKRATRATIDPLYEAPFPQLAFDKQARLDACSDEEIAKYEQEAASAQAVLDSIEREYPSLSAAWNDYCRHKKLVELRIEIDRSEEALRQEEQTVELYKERTAQTLKSVERRREEKRRKTEAYEALERGGDDDD